MLISFTRLTTYLALVVLLFVPYCFCRKYDKCVMMQGVNLEGEHVEEPKDIQSSGDCCDLCYANPKCIGFSYYAVGKNCWLKDTILWRDNKNDDNHTSGIIQSRYSKSCEDFVDLQFMGTPYREITNVTHSAECCEHCFHDSYCAGYSLHTYYKKCSLINELMAGKYRVGYKSGIVKKVFHKEVNQSSFSLTGLFLTISVVVNVAVILFWANKRGYFNNLRDRISSGRDKQIVQFESLADDDNAGM